MLGNKNSKSAAKVSWLKSDSARETAGVAIVFLAVFIFISLISLDPADPALGDYLDGKRTVANYAGVLGATIGGMIAAFLGLTAYLVPVATASLGGYVFLDRKPESALKISTGSIMLLLSVNALMSVYLSADPLFAEVRSGGTLGGFVADTVVIRFIGKIGGTMALLAMAVSALAILTGITIRTAGDFLIRYAKIAGEKILAIITAISRYVWDVASESTSEFRGWVEEKMETDAERAQREKQERSGELKREREEWRKDPPKIVTPEIEEIPPGITVSEAEDFVTQGRLPFETAKPPKRKSAAKKIAIDIPAGSGGESGYEYDYKKPPLSLLDMPDQPKIARVSDEELFSTSEILERKLLDFGVNGKVVQVLPGPVITMYEYEPAPGVKVSKITGLQDDLALALRASSIRIMAPVPGKAVVGIEVPNHSRETVYLKQVLGSPEFNDNPSSLTLALGVDTAGKPMVTDLARIPHLLIAGSTGTGKSVGLNCMICSILYKSDPSEVKMIMIDPKMLELSLYDGIPHLIAPVVTNPKKAANALRWAVEEMERRYKLMALLGVRNIDGYNKRVLEIEEEEPPAPEPDTENIADEEFAPLDDESASADSAAPETVRHEKLPKIVVIIDELADLMMVSSKDVEDSLARLAQMARAAGIHLIVATQRPSVDVLTGLIKANFPSRVSFQVTSRIDSRTILDAIGAERLLGKGDMLFLPPGTSRLVRIHGAFITDTETARVVKTLKQQAEPNYDENILKPRAEETESADAIGEEDADEFYDQAVSIVAQTGQASISMIQRRLKIGYNRAARIIESMEKQGLVGPADGAKPRQVFVRDIDTEDPTN